MPGTLYVVATPLGNLEDLSPRALRTLRSVQCIACEDTRRTRRLMRRFQVEARTLSCHKFNERDRLEPVLRLLRGGSDVALVSDGGTPGVSDPGAFLVRAAADEGITIAPVPGPSAAVALLSASGFQAERFHFEGFLPHRAGERRRRLRELRGLPHGIVLFDAPHRIRDTLEDLAEIMGERPMTLGRELTKLHESILRGTAREILAALGDRPVRGEITLAITGTAATGADAGREGIASTILDVWRVALEDAAGDRREALRRSARALRMKRADLYRRLAELGEAD